METQESTIQVKSRVKNIKTRVVGVVETLEDIKAQVLSTDGVRIECRVADLEILNIEEYELVKALVEARQKKTELNKQLEEAKSEAARIEDKMIDYMRVRGLQSTAPYHGIGKVEIEGMKVMPSITEEKREIAFAVIREMGRGEIIKESIHPATLTNFVTELINNGTKVPESISYFLKPNLSFRKK